jgi:hypothetical protein
VRGTSSQSTTDVALCRIAAPQSNAAAVVNTVSTGSSASSGLVIVLVTLRGFV